MKVKDQLAGRKGICPECGARFRIPLESRADAGRPAAAVEPVAPVAPPLSPTGVPVARVVSLDADLAASLPRALPLALPESGRPPT